MKTKELEDTAMSGNACLEIKQYKNAAEKMSIRKKAYEKMYQYVDNEGTDFDEDKWREDCFDFDEIFNFLPSESVQKLIKNRPGFVPDVEIDKFRAEVGNDFLIKEDEKDFDCLRVVSISKEDIILLIKEYHQVIARYYKWMLEKAESKDFWELDTLQDHLKSKAKEWECGANNELSLNEDGKLDTPWPLSWSTEWIIVGLIEIVNKYDWDNVDVALYFG